MDLEVLKKTFSLDKRQVEEIRKLDVGEKETYLSHRQDGHDHTSSIVAVKLSCQPQQVMVEYGGEMYGRGKY